MQNLSSPTMPAETWTSWQQNVPSMLSLLQEWINARAVDPAWYQEQMAVMQSATANDKPLNLLFKALGFTPRKLGKHDLALNPAELARAHSLRAGFDPGRWSVDQAARVGLILSIARQMSSCADFARLLDQLTEQGEIGEQIALYQGFALYPQDPALSARAGEAVRNGMRPVFAAIALRNPWPQYVFDEATWNQMVVKTFFLDLPVWPIQGIAQRANPDLSGILLDLAEERQAAGRIVNPELWRLVALCPGERGLDVLQKMAASADSRQLRILALACQHSRAPEIQELRTQLLAMCGTQSETDWHALAQWQE